MHTFLYLFVISILYYRIILRLHGGIISPPEQTSIIAVATTLTVVTTSKLKPPQEKILKVPTVKPKSTKDQN